MKLRHLPTPFDAAPVQCTTHLWRAAGTSSWMLHLSWDSGRAGNGPEPCGSPPANARPMPVRTPTGHHRHCADGPEWAVEGCVREVHRAGRCSHRGLRTVRIWGLPGRLKKVFRRKSSHGAGCESFSTARGKMPPTVRLSNGNFDPPVRILKPAFLRVFRAGLNGSLDLRPAFAGQHGSPTVTG